MTGLIKVSRSTKELLVKIKQIEDDYIKKGEEITLDKIAYILKISKEEVAFALESKARVESIDEKLYDSNQDGETKISQIKDEKDENNNLINRMCINELIKELEKREQEIIILRYFQNKTQTEVAKRLGISQVQVSRIEKKVLLTMRSKINA